MTRTDTASKGPTKQRKTTRGTRGGGKTPRRRTPRTRKPDDMSLEAWQIALRREFGREQDYKLTNLGEHPVFSRFGVNNPKSGGMYRVTIRGRNPGDNHCTCPDFAINTLGTCKHIEFTLAKLEKKRGGKRTLSEGFSPPQSQVYLRYDARRDVVFQPGAACPPAVRKLAGEYFDKDGRLMPDAYARFERFIEQANAEAHEVLVHEDVLDFVAQVRDREALRRRLEAAFKGAAGQRALEKLLKVKLYPYQRQGAMFAAQAGRALLADDMGLGKTIQAIAAAEILAQHGGAQRTLIVCPTSLKHQWKHEIEKFTHRDGDDVRVVEGLSDARDAAYRADAFYKIINYDVVHRDLPAIEAWSPDLVILDEAQRIKNWQTRTAKTVKQLDSPYAIVLTGTPLENRLEELYSIVEFVDRDRLGPMFRFLHEHQHVDETGRVVGYRNLDRIGRTLEPIMIRRTRKGVLTELPQRLDKRLFVPMTAEQQRHHDENREIVARVVAKWRRYGFLGDADQRRLMIALQNMRMSCNSTYLLDQTTDHGVKADELCDQLGDIFEDSESKVVIFSQWVRTHELLTERLKRRGWGHVTFHGGVPSPKRKELVKQFKQDEDCRCFLSTDAGGVGLNLQHANVVINVDQPWNPAVLEQRIGRVHRLGQQRPVHVIHLIAQGTIEEGMLSLINFKQSMFAGVFDGGQQEVFLGGTKLKRFMETVDKATGGISSPMAAEPGEPGDAGERETTAGGNGAARGGRGAAEDQAAAASPGAQDGWAELAQAGMALFDKLGQALRGGEGGSSAAKRKAADDAGRAAGDVLQRVVARDEKTGEPYVRLPMPDAKTLRTIADALSSLVKQL